MVEGGVVVEAGVIVKRQVKVEATLAALAVTMMIGKAIQELMSSLPSLGVLVAPVTHARHVTSNTSRVYE